MDTTIAQKNEIRRQIRLLKTKLTDAEKELESNRVFKYVEEMIEFQLATTVLMYWSLSDELPTHAFVQKWANQKQILLPTVVGDEMEVKLFSGGNDLKMGDFGILEPENTSNFEGKIDFIIVPGMAFDQQKNRLGRGKGYYDRFLKNTNAYKCGVCFNFQLLDFVPFTADDVCMDKVISSSKTIG